MIQIETKTVKMHTVGDAEFKTLVGAKIHAIKTLATETTLEGVVDIERMADWMIGNADTLIAILKQKARKPRTPKATTRKPRSANKPAATEPAKE